MGRIFITGDTHTSKEMYGKFNTKNFPTQKELTKNDVVIVLGDFGAITWDESKETKYNRDWLASKNFTTCFVDGNHDNFDLLDKLPQIHRFDNRVGIIETKNGWIFHLQRGLQYTINNKFVLALGGATSIDKMDRLPNVSWWEAEEWNWYEEKTLKDTLKENNKFDLVLSHTSPNYVVDEFLEVNYKYPCSVQDLLEKVALDIEFDKWYFGHLHLNKTIGKFNCLYNKITEVV